MAEYLIDDKTVFEIFKRNDKNLRRGLFPIMSEFEQEELNFWRSELRRIMTGANDLFIEMGCGSGRVLRGLQKVGIQTVGFDNNPLFIKYCREQGLDVFEFDALDVVPEVHRNKYRAVGVALNTLFNFDIDTRRQWLNTAKGLGTNNSSFIFSVYIDNDQARKSVEERRRYFEAAIEPPKGYTVEFFDTGDRRGFHLLSPEKNEEWSSLWVGMQELESEVATWADYKLEKLELMNCGIGANVLLGRN